MAAVLLTASVARAQETTEYYGIDALGSIRVVFDQSGGVVARTDYMPFGEEVFAPGLMPKERFTGQERDGEAGLDYFHARMLQPRAGRFNTADPVFGNVAAPQSFNRYAYARSSPANFIDPSGLACRRVINDHWTIDVDCNPSAGDGPILWDRSQPIDRDPDRPGHTPTPPTPPTTPVPPTPVPPTPVPPTTPPTPPKAPGNQPGWWHGFFSSLFSSHNWVTATDIAIEKGYYSCWASKISGGVLAPVVTHSVGVGATKAVEKGAPRIAGAYYHYTDGRFTAWGKYSNVLVPNLASKIAAGAYALDVAGWAFFDYEIYHAISECEDLL